jgi:exonuclease III
MIVGSLSSFIMSSNSISFNFVSWNVRGLGNAKKCDVIKETLLNNPSDLVLFQETKLSVNSQFKAISFLPNYLQNFNTIDVTNASRGILTAWNSSNLKLLSTLANPFSISSKFESESNGAIFWVTNVYGPNLDEDRPIFFEELKTRKIISIICGELQEISTQSDPP